MRSIKAEFPSRRSLGLSSWSQSEEDIRFAYRMAEATKGRVIFTAGKDLDRYVVWDYIKRRKSIIA